MSNIICQIIKELKENNGISSHHLAKKLKLYRSNVEYYLLKLLDEEIVEKVGSKYFLTKTSFILNGMAVVHDSIDNQFFFFNCPYFGECDCQNKTFEDCKTLKELPANIRELVYETEN